MFSGKKLYVWTTSLFILLRTISQILVLNSFGCFAIRRHVQPNNGFPKSFVCSLNGCSTLQILLLSSPYCSMMLLGGCQWTVIKRQDLIDAHCSTVEQTEKPWVNWCVALTDVSRQFRMSAGTRFCSNFPQEVSSNLLTEKNKGCRELWFSLMDIGGATRSLILRDIRNHY